MVPLINMVATARESSPDAEHTGCSTHTRCRALGPLDVGCFAAAGSGPILEPCGEYLEGKGGGKPLLVVCPAGLRNACSLGCCRSVGALCVTALVPCARDLLKGLEVRAADGFSAC